MIQDELQALASKYDLVYLVVVDLSTGKITEFGDKTKLIRNGLINMFDDVSVLNQSLEGQLLPTSWSQGKEYCLVMKPTPTLLAGAYYQTDKTFSETIVFENRLAAELGELLVK
jgi:hypothetical protein